jgi:parallel beta-helix repeat protein
MANYYVSGTGRDSNPGTSEAIAFRTLQKAADLVKAGDTVYIMNGTYEQPKYLNTPVLSLKQKNGTPEKPIAFKAYSGHKPLLKSNGNYHTIHILGSSYILIEGLTLLGYNDSITLEYAQKEKTNKANTKTNGGGIDITADGNVHSHHVIIRNNTISKFPANGIGMKEVDYVTIEGNNVSECAYYSIWGTQGITCLNAWNMDDNTTDYKIIIRDNVCHHNYQYIPWFQTPDRVSEGHGIMIDSSDSAGLDGQAYKGKTLISNNLCYKNGGAGIEVFKSHKVDVINNTCYQNSNHPDLATVGEIFMNGAYESTVVNNIMFARKNAPSYVVNKGSVKGDYNLIYNTNKFDSMTNPIVANPLFVDVESYNFTIQEDSGAFVLKSQDYGRRTVTKIEEYTTRVFESIGRNPRQRSIDEVTAYL